MRNRTIDSVLDTMSDSVDGDLDEKRLQAMAVIDAIAKKYHVEVKIPCFKCGDDEYQFCGCWKKV